MSSQSQKGRPLAEFDFSFKNGNKVSVRFEQDELALHAVSARTGRSERWIAHTTDGLLLAGEIQDPRDIERVWDVVLWIAGKWSPQNSQPDEGHSRALMTEKAKERDPATGKLATMAVESEIARFFNLWNEARRRWTELRWRGLPA